MFNHINLGDTGFARKRRLAELVKSDEIKLGGYKKNKIYGTLSCNSGKKMKAENRVFFQDEQEALQAGYRPCGHCMPKEYKAWKTRNKK